MKNMNAKTLVFRTMFKFYVGTQPKLCWTNIYLKFLYTFFLDIDTLFALNKMSCGICETTFSDDIDDDAHCPKPKILSCLHILCTVCLADRIQVVPEENVVLTICPICSTPTIKPLPADYLQREENNLVSRTISYDSDMSVSHVDTTPTQYYPSQVESTYGGEMDTSVYSDLPDELLDMYNEGEEAPHYEDIYIQNDRIDDSTELDHDGDGYSQDDDLQSHKSQESAVSDSRDRAGGAKSELVALAHWTLVFIDLIIILSVCIYRFIGDSIFAENSVIQIRASAETQTMVCALLLTHLLLQEMSSSSLFTGYHQIADATQEDNNIVSVLLVAADVAAVVSLLVAAVGSSVSLVCQIIAQELLNYLHLPSISTADVVMGIAGVAMISSALYHALYDDSPPESTYSQQKANPFATPTVPAAAKFTSPPQSNQSNQTSRFISTTSTNRSSGNRSRQSLQSHRQSQRYTSPEAGRGVNSASSRTPPQRTSLSPKVTPMDNPLRKVTFRPPARTRGAAVAADISVDLDYADIYGPSSGEGGGGRGRGGRDKAASASIFGSDGRSRRASPPLEELLQQAFHEGEDGVVGTVTPSASRQAEQRVNSAQKAHVKAQAAAEAIRLERLQHTGQQALLIQAQEQAAVATAAEEARVALEQARLRQEALIALEQERAVREASEKLAEQLAKSARPPVLSPPRSIHRADRHTPSEERGSESSSPVPFSTLSDQSLSNSSATATATGTGSTAAVERVVSPVPSSSGASAASKLFASSDVLSDNEDHSPSNAVLGGSRGIALTVSSTSSVALVNFVLPTHGAPAQGREMRLSSGPPNETSVDVNALSRHAKHDQEESSVTKLCPTVAYSPLQSFPQATITSMELSPPDTPLAMEALDAEEVKSVLSTACDVHGEREPIDCLLDRDLLIPPAIALFPAEKETRPRSNEELELGRGLEDSVEIEESTVARALATAPSSPPSRSSFLVASPSKRKKANNNIRKFKSMYAYSPPTSSPAKATQQGLSQPSVASPVLTASAKGKSKRKGGDQKIGGFDAMDAPADVPGPSSGKGVLKRSDSAHSLASKDSSLGTISSYSTAGGSSLNSSFNNINNLYSTAAVVASAAASTSAHKHKSSAGTTTSGVASAAAAGFATDGGESVASGDSRSTRNRSKAGSPQSVRAARRSAATPAAVEGSAPLQISKSASKLSCPSPTGLSESSAYMRAYEMKKAKSGDALSPPPAPVSASAAISLSTREEAPLLQGELLDVSALEASFDLVECMRTPSVEGEDADEYVPSNTTLFTGAEGRAVLPAPRRDSAGNRMVAAARNFSDSYDSDTSHSDTTYCSSQARCDSDDESIAVRVPKAKGEQQQRRGLQQVVPEPEQQMQQREQQRGGLADFKVTDEPDTAPRSSQGVYRTLSGIALTSVSEPPSPAPVPVLAPVLGVNREPAPAVEGSAEDGTGHQIVVVADGHAGISEDFSSTVPQVPEGSDATGLTADVDVSEASAHAEEPFAKEATDIEVTEGSQVVTAEVQSDEQGQEEKPFEEANADTAESNPIATSNSSDVPVEEEGEKREEEELSAEILTSAELTATANAQPSSASFVRSASTPHTDITVCEGAVISGTDSTERNPSVVDLSQSPSDSAMEGHITTDASPAFTEVVVEMSTEEMPTAESINITCSDLDQHFETVSTEESSSPPPQTQQAASVIRELEECLDAVVEAIEQKEQLTGAEAEAEVPPEEKEEVVSTEVSKEASPTDVQAIIAKAFVGDALNHSEATVDDAAVDDDKELFEQQPTAESPILSNEALASQFESLAPDAATESSDSCTVAVDQPFEDVYDDGAGEAGGDLISNDANNQAESSPPYGHDGVAHVDTTISAVMDALMAVEEEEEVQGEDEGGTLPLDTLTNVSSFPIMDELLELCAPRKGEPHHHFTVAPTAPGALQVSSSAEAAQQEQTGEEFFSAGVQSTSPLSPAVGLSSPPPSFSKPPLSKHVSICINAELADQQGLSASPLPLESPDTIVTTYRDDVISPEPPIASTAAECDAEEADPDVAGEDEAENESLGEEARMRIDVSMSPDGDMSQITAPSPAPNSILSLSQLAAPTPSPYKQSPIYMNLPISPYNYVTGDYPTSGGGPPSRTSNTSSFISGSGGGGGSGSRSKSNIRASIEERVYARMRRKSMSNMPGSAQQRAGGSNVDGSMSEEPSPMGSAEGGSAVSTLNTPEEVDRFEVEMQVLYGEFLPGGAGKFSAGGGGSGCGDGGVSSAGSAGSRDRLTPTGGVGGRGGGSAGRPPSTGRSSVSPLDVSTGVRHISPKPNVEMVTTGTSPIRVLRHHTDHSADKVTASGHDRQGSASRRQDSVLAAISAEGSGEKSAVPVRSPDRPPVTSPIPVRSPDRPNAVLHRSNTVAALSSPGMSGKGDSYATTVRPGSMFHKNADVHAMGASASSTPIKHVPSVISRVTISGTGAGAVRGKHSPVGPTTPVSLMKRSSTAAPGSATMMAMRNVGTLGTVGSVQSVSSSGTSGGTPRSLSRAASSLDCVADMMDNSSCYVVMVHMNQALTSHRCIGKIAKCIASVVSKCQQRQCPVAVAVSTPLSPPNVLYWLYAVPNNRTGASVSSLTAAFQSSASPSLSASGGSVGSAHSPDTAAAVATVEYIIKAKTKSCLLLPKRMDATAAMDVGLTERMYRTVLSGLVSQEASAVTHLHVHHLDGDLKSGFEEHLLSLRAEIKLALASFSTTTDIVVVCDSQSWPFNAPPELAGQSTALTKWSTFRSKVPYLQFHFVAINTLSSSASTASLLSVK